MAFKHIIDSNTKEGKLLVAALAVLVETEREGHLVIDGQGYQGLTPDEIFELIHKLANKELENNYKK